MLNQKNRKRRKEIRKRKIERKLTDLLIYYSVTERSKILFLIWLISTYLFTPLLYGSQEFPYVASLIRHALWSSGQGSWLQIQRSAFDSRRYQIF
jgi:hypothetical protein